jgi:hypothetical protein
MWLRSAAYWHSATPLAVFHRAFAAEGRAVADDVEEGVTVLAAEDLGAFAAPGGFVI